MTCEKVNYNDFRDAMTILFDDMSDLYKQVFVLAFYENMTPDEIAKTTGKPLFFVHSIVNHLSELGDYIQNDLDDAALGVQDFYKKLYLRLFASGRS